MEEENKIGGVSPYQYIGGNKESVQNDEPEGFLNLERTDEALNAHRHKRFVKRLVYVIRLGIVPDRQPGEPFDDYKLRKNYLKRQLHMYKKGSPIYLNQRYFNEPVYTKTKNVPYSLAMHGPITNTQKAKILKLNERRINREERWTK